MKRPTSDKLNLTTLRTAALAALFVVVILGNSGTARAAGVWSGCVKVTGISDYRAHNGGIRLSVSPAIPGCNTSGLPWVQVVSGQNNANAETVKTALAMALFVKATGGGVMFFYDNATPLCYVRIMAVGGYQGQC